MIEAVLSGGPRRRYLPGRRGPKQQPPKPETLNPTRNPNPFKGYYRVSINGLPLRVPLGLYTRAPFKG